MAKYQGALFLDLEGTLLKKAHHLDTGEVAPSAWALVAHTLGGGVYEEELETQKKWKSGEYAGYVEWMEATIAIHQRHNLTKDQFTEILDSVELMDGANELALWAKDRNIVMSIVTGGFKHLSDRVQKVLKIEHAFAACEYFFDEGDGMISAWNLLPSDERGKIRFMDLVLEEHKISRDNAVFIGDGINDRHVAEHAAMSIAFCAQKELREVASHCIDEEDLSKAIPLLEAHFSRNS